MALTFHRGFAKSGLREFSGSFRFCRRDIASSCIRSRDARSVQKDNPNQTNPEPQVPLKKHLYDKLTYRTLDAGGTPPPTNRVRADDDFWRSPDTEQESPVRFHATARSPDPPGFQGSNPLDERIGNANATQPVRRAKRSEKPLAVGDELEPANLVGIFVDGQPVSLSPILLRDLCECNSCLDPSTKQKIFSTADIPSDIKTRAIARGTSGVTILWENDISGYGDEHATTIDMDTFRSLRDVGGAPSADTSAYEPGKQLIWDANQYRQLQDIDYDAYMQDGATLFHALQQLHTFGLLFLRNVPEDEKSVSNIAERIGPLKNTFYGYTWDVKSVPKAKNVAYTSQNLGFHMDLMYMHQPPHLQFLHCIRSSAAGGASLFADSFKAATDLFKEDVESFLTLATVPASFHYNHPSSHLYHQDWPVIQTGYLTNGFPTFLGLANAYRKELRHRDSQAGRARDLVAAFQQSAGPDIVDHIKHMAWSPPFQAPLRLSPNRVHEASGTPGQSLNRKVTKWHRAAQKFSALIHREQGMYERLMRPGECVIFDNRRVLHARRAFEVGDAGKERWLRGAYLDWDPYWSKLSILGKKFGQGA